MDPRNHIDFCSFKATFDTLSMFLADYKKSVHEKDDEQITPASTEIMDVEPEKKAIVARCTQNSGPKEVPPSPLLKPADNCSTATSNSLLTPRSENSTKHSSRNSISSNTAPLPKAVKSPVKNPNNPKLSKNGASKTSKQSCSKSPNDKKHPCLAWHAPPPLKPGYPPGSTISTISFRGNRAWRV